MLQADDDGNETSSHADKTCGASEMSAPHVTFLARRDETALTDIRNIAQTTIFSLDL